MNADEVAQAERRSEAGARLGGFIYGTIVILAVIVAGARAFPDDALRIAATVAATAFVFWLAHVYAHSLAHAVANDEHLAFATVRQIARREFPIVEAAVPSLAALLVGATGVISVSAAGWCALILGLAVLGVQGVVFARIERLGLFAGALVVALNLGLGILLIALKLAVSH